MIEYGWGDDEQTYFVITFKDNWTVDDYSQMFVATYSKVRHLDYQVNFIVDLRYSAVPPMNIFSTVADSIRRSPDSIGRVVIITSTTVWKRLFNAINSTLQNIHLDIVFVSTMDEAYPLILPNSDA